MGSVIDEQRHAAAKAVSETLYTLYNLRNAFLKVAPKMSRKHHEIAMAYHKQGESLSEHMEQVYVTLRDRLVEVSEDNLQTVEEEKISEPDKPELNIQLS